MLNLYLRIRNWLQREEGQDLIEYALLAAFIAVALIALLPTTRAWLQGIWGQINAMLAAAGA